jgi:uncharacterized protein (DUF433 family)
MNDSIPGVFSERLSHGTSIAHIVLDYDWCNAVDSFDALRYGGIGTDVAAAGKQHGSTGV